MRILTISVIMILTFIFETTLARYIAIFGISPDITILIIVSFAILRYELEGALIGFFAGLLIDLFSGSTLGINALLYLIIGYFSGKPFKEFYAENYFFPLLLVGIATFFYNFAYYVIHFLLRARLDFFHYFFAIMLPSTLYTMALSVPFYIFIYLINRKLEAHEKSHRRLFGKD